jgi:aconitate hydratase
VAGDNCAQGSSREHAAIAPRYLELIAVIAKSYARLGWQNLINFGIVPLEFINKDDYGTVEELDIIKLENILETLPTNKPILAINETKQLTYQLRHSLSERQVKVVLAGGVINYFRMPSTKPEKVEVISDEM